VSKNTVVNGVQRETGPCQESSQSKSMDLVHASKGTRPGAEGRCVDDKCHPCVMAPGREGSTGVQRGCSTCCNGLL